MTDFIPVYEPTLQGNELKYVTDAVKSGWISSLGKYISLFESGFSKYIGAKAGVAVCNGTVALHLALKALGIGEGDEVIVPDLTFVATANAVKYAGAKPVFVDADKETWCIDAAKIEEKITKKTKAIMPVHIYGHPCEMGKIMGLAGKYKLKVIEDAAEAHGAEYNGKKVGSIGDVGCFSFYANKIITTGEGGMVVTNDKEMAEKARSMKNLCFGQGAERFLHKGLGYNYRMTNIQAAIGLAQMENAEKLVEARRKNAKKYSALLGKEKKLILPAEKGWAKNVYWMYGVVLGDETKVSKEEVMKRLEEKGIGTRPFFVPLHKQPFLSDGLLSVSKCYPDCSGRYPVAEWLGERGFYLPSSSMLTEEQIKRVCDAVKEVLNR